MPEIFEQTGKNINETTGALKETEGKLRFDLIPPEMDRIFALVTTYASKKYPDRNWEKGFMFIAQHLSALKRHLNLWELNFNVDNESNLNHMYHVAWHANAMATQIYRGRMDLDDRPAAQNIELGNDDYYDNLWESEEAKEECYRALEEKAQGIKAGHEDRFDGVYPNWESNDK